MSDAYPIYRVPGFSLVDPAIREWCKLHTLNLVTDFKDSDVRSVDVVGPDGKKCQVWVDPPKDAAVTVHVWPYGPPHDRIAVPVAEIAAALERAYAIAARHVGAKS